MTRDEYVEDIKLTLGAPTVMIENEAEIPKFVDMAFNEIKSHLVETHFVTFPYTSKGIDVSAYNIDTVVQIFRTANPSRVADFTDIYSLSTLNQANSSNVNLLLSDYLYRTQMNQLKSTITTDLDFTYDADTEKLYVSAFYPYPQKITLAYIPRYDDVSLVREQFWVNYIRRLALAFTEISLGNIRSKYDLSSSLYKVNGADMLQQGIAERDAIRTELTENSDLVFPID